METSTSYQVCVTSAAAAVVAGVVTYVYYKHKRRPRDASEVFDYLKIVTVTTEECCDKVVDELRRRSKKYNALGFDCEWVTEKQGKRRPVAYIQLSSYDGYCGLFNMNVMKSIPPSLKSLLEDETIYKVGVAPADDSQYLFHDFGVACKQTLDLRHLADLSRHEPGGLAFLAKSVLGAVMDKSWKVRCSDWEAEELTTRQVNYAAIDAHAAIRIYTSLLQRLRWQNAPFPWSTKWEPDELCRRLADRKYKARKNNNNNKAKSKEPKVGKDGVVMSKRYPNATRSKPLYHNCFLQAPDGELLCTCDSKKALWYVEKELADVVKEDPLTVRLRFEPAGRSVGDVGRYYQLQKENKCVVCGGTNSYIRKNVVPREYRKYFPEIMKDHSSHDVVLLCCDCHQVSNMRDQAVRERLAALCSAPFAAHHSSNKYTEDSACKRIRSAARALHYQSRKHELPEARRKELEDIILQYYPLHNEITVELLREACELQVIYENAEYESHGMKVVEYFLEREGLLRLEEVWRQHFLDSMEPKYMPELWSIKHNEERCVMLVIETLV
ncbi:exonuclease 3'-5' domain-containing 2 isoform X2 [Anticarsia gemmatalis]|uniref:exonuclease 3'-5' domain-containing 2 isoform X2 n=1 Tax=Anticarsia gemmatalis TaxID=129554 RepID=UPI003F771AF5